MTCSCNERKFEGGWRTDEPDGFRRGIWFRPAFECDGPKREWYGRMMGEHGQCDGMFQYVLAGPRVAISFAFHTGWFPGSLDRYSDDRNSRENLSAPSGNTIQTHRIDGKPGEEPFGPCEYLNGAQCYGGASFLASDDALRILVMKGEKALWEHLKGWHDREVAAYVNVTP